MLKTIVILSLFILTANASVDKAINFLKLTCVTKGSALNISSTKENLIKIENFLEIGEKGSIFLTHLELNEFVKESKKLSKSHSINLQNCMNSYIKEASYLLSKSKNS